MGFLDKLVENKVGKGEKGSEKGEVRKVGEDEGARIAFDLDSDFDLDNFESGGRGTSESEGLNSDSTGAPPAGGWIKWGQIQTEILTAFLQDEEVWGGTALQELATRLRSNVSDFEMIVEQTDPKVWSKERLNKLLQMEKIRNRDYSWDEVEVVAIGKLAQIVQDPRMTKTAEILAIAQAANRAHRRSGGNQMTPGNNTTINVMNNGGGAEIQLPGAGHIGTMKLTLSAKTVGQLSKGITIDATAEKYTDGIEMLGGDDVPELSKLADES